jgi:hypothetical protein
MVKGSKQESALTEICDYNGTQFANEREQKNIIRSHFADSFRRPAGEPDNLQGCIEDCLGEEILAHPLI